MLNLIAFHERLSIVCVYAVKLLSLSSEPLTPYFLKCYSICVDRLKPSFLFIYESSFTFLFRNGDSMEAKQETHIVSYISWPSLQSLQKQ